MVPKQKKILISLISLVVNIILIVFNQINKLTTWTGEIIKSTDSFHFFHLIVCCCNTKLRNGHLRCDHFTLNSWL